MTPARFRWGIYFILAGGLILLHNFGVVDWYVWEDIVALWPIILIAIGVEKIFAKSKAVFISYLAPVLFSGIVLWVAIGSSYSNLDFSRRGDTYKYEIEKDAEISSVEMTLDVKNVDINLKKTASDLFNGRFKRRKYKPDIDYDVSNGIAKIDIAEEKRIWGWGDSHYRSSYDNWNIRVADHLPLSLKFYGGKSDMEIDCKSLNLQELFVRSERGRINMYLGEMLENIKVSLEGEDANFSVYAPENSGIKVSGYGDDLRRLFERIGFIETDDAYTNPDYNSRLNKIELELSPDISQLSIDFY
ncbi:MAG: DUF5668 domain-containing protein [candidate division Zixibacteria bacterium]